MTEPAARNVHELISDVMADVRAVGKDSINKAQGSGYRFRGIDAVMNAVGPALRKHGVTVMPHKLQSIDYQHIVVGEKKTAMTSVRLVVVYRWRGPLGDHVDSVVPGEAFDAGDKGTAKAMSVAYRTMLLQALTLPTDEPDPDSMTYAQTASPEEARDLGRWRGEVSAAGYDPGKLTALWNRMRAEWDTVPWSPERHAILQEAIDAAKNRPAETVEEAPEPAPEGDPNVQAAAEAWDAEWRAELAAAADARNATQIRALQKRALENNARELAKEAAAALAALRKDKA